MASVTQRVPNYLGGVSKQPDDKKFPGQVREALNAYPDPTFGLQKRPGLKFLTALKDSNGNAITGTTLDAAKWFYIHRNNDRKIYRMYCRCSIFTIWRSSCMECYN